MKKPISRGKFLKKVVKGALGVGALANFPFYNLQPYDPSLNLQKEDLAIKGFHIDLKTQVMTMQALENFGDQLARFGINAIVMEYEASYPYENHATISNEYAYTREEIKGFVSHCASLGIEVIPLKATLGHVQYILRHERYAGLKIENEILSQLDPLNENAFTLYDELIRDLISLHPSKYIHLGGDEARHLEHPNYEAYNEKYGPSKLYVEYMKRICNMAIERGKKPLLWADMILQYPDAIEELPIDKIIFIDWNYGWEINHFGDIGALQEKGCTFWGAPAVRSWPDDYFLVTWRTHFDNLKDYIPYTQEANYGGIINTSWTCGGFYYYHWEGTPKDLVDMFPNSNRYPLSGFRILVAAYARALEIDEPLDPRQFVIDYAQERFGISAADGKTLWDYFAHEQQVRISDDDARNPQKMDALLREFQNVNSVIHHIDPAHNTEEFKHFLLMGDIREFYLAVRKVESMIESPGFDLPNGADISSELEPLLATSEELNELFISLNTGYLYDAELKRLNQLRNKRLHYLCDRYCT